MTLAQLESLMEKVNSDYPGGYPCKYGHASCSPDRTGGRCSDELWQQPCSDESRDEYLERMGVSDVSDV
jgi:hypothetical protein